MVPLLGLLLVLLALAATIGSIIAIARWILRPLDQAAKGREAPAQFTLVDFLCLVFMAQLPTGLVRWVFHESESGTAWLAYGFAWIACGLLWWTAIRTLGRAGVHGTWKRAGFLALVLPMTIFGIILVLPLLGVILDGLCGDDPWGRRGIWLPLLAEVGFLAGFYLSGRYTRWLVASATGAHGDRASATRSEQDRKP